MSADIVLGRCLSCLSSTTRPGTEVLASWAGARLRHPTTRPTALKCNMAVGRSPFVFFYHITYLAPSSFVLLLLFPTLNVLFATRGFRPPATRGFRPPATRGFSGVQTPRPGGHSIPDPFVVLVCFGPAGAVLRSLKLTSGTHTMGFEFLFLDPQPLLHRPLCGR